MEGKQKILFPLLFLLCACSNNIEEHRVKTHKLHPSNIGVCEYYKSYQTRSTVNHFFFMLQTVPNGNIQNFRQIFTRNI